MPVNLIQRRQKIRQERAKLQVAETWADLGERKARTRRLIELGARVEHHSIAHMSDAAREGALDELDAMSRDPKNVQRWTKAGEVKAARKADRAAFVIIYRESISTETIAALKKAGFRLNRLRGIWEGLTDLEEATRLAAAHNGKLERLELPGDGEQDRLAAE